MTPLASVFIQLLGQCCSPTSLLAWRCGYVLGPGVSALVLAGLFTLWGLHYMDFEDQVFSFLAMSQSVMGRPYRIGSIERSLYWG